MSLWPGEVRFKYAGFSGPHPTLVVPCPTCGSPAGHYCNGADGRPVDGPHRERRVAAGTLAFARAARAALLNAASDEGIER